MMTVDGAFDLALQHHRAGRLAEAEALYQQVLAAQPGHADGLHMLGVIASQSGRDEVAAELILKAIALAPFAAGFHSNLGEVYRKQGFLDNAIAAYRRALQLNPDMPEAHSNLGNALNEQGRQDEALDACRRALQLKPDYAEAINNLGNALQKQGKFEEALAAYHRALELRPDYATACYNIGNALKEQGLLDQAIATYRRALQLKPDLLAAHNNMANALKDEGRLDEAIAVYRNAQEIHPYVVEAHSNFLMALHYLAAFDEVEIFREHLRWQEAHARPLARRMTPPANDRDPGRRLRIGYVSPDYRAHSVAFFIEPLIANHDRSMMEVFCYSDVQIADEVSGRFRQHAAQWRTITGMRDEHVAQLILNDRIDILIDLAGHTAHNRLLVFARKPAPVQVTYLGYCDTTGLTALDYRLTDALADPPGTTEHLHSEQLIHLPDCAWCYRPPEPSPPVLPPPALRSGHVTFGCFNVRPKITDDMLALWARLLSQVPGSRLLLKNLGFGEASVRLRTLALLQDAGIAPERIELIGRVPSLAEHLATYGKVDIALDTFPYHGTTTTCEALWMGVPVITLAGRTHASRVGVSLLTHAGLPELIASSADEYVHIATRLAADIERLSKLRSSLRERLAASLLLDSPRFTRNVEHAYRQIWRTWCEKHASLPAT